jgi:signal transduction histidine kinase
MVFLLVLIVALWAARTADEALTRNVHTGMEAQAQLFQRTISTRLENHEETLRSNAALLQSGEGTDVAHWQQYLEAYDHLKRYPSLVSVGVAKYVSSPDELIVNFTWPSSSEPPVGTNLSAMEDYASLMSRSSAASEITIVPDTSDSKRLLIGLPLYPNGERVANGEPHGSKPVGLVYGELTTATLFPRALAVANLSDLDIQVFTGTSDTPVYTSPGFGDTTGDIELQKTYYFYGQALRIQFQSPRLSLVTKTQIDGPLLIVGGGLLAGLLISSIVYLLLMTRSRELQIQKTLDVELAKDDLLSLASHQLRTPATGVKQYLGMVIQGFAGSVTDRQRSLLEKAYASNDRQLAVINEVLHLAKIESGRITLAKQKVNISDLVQDVVNEQAPDIKRANHAVTVQLPLRPVLIQVDNHMLRMAIENLVSNAIKYTPENGKIKISVIGSRHYVRVSVKDSGVGIADEDIGKLFKQFTRLQNEMSFQVSGTGVGLYLVKHLVELHGGKVNVVSERGTGSTFTITLPRQTKNH